MVVGQNKRLSPISTRSRTASATRSSAAAVGRRGVQVLLSRASGTSADGPHARALVKDEDHTPYTGVIVGARADEEGSRSKERYFSPRDKHNDWDVGDQPPEFWNQYKTDFAPGTHVRIHPLLDWTELNIWEYIERENIPVVALLRPGKRHALPLPRLRSLHVASPFAGQERRRHHRGAAQRQVQQHRRAHRPRPGQG